MKYQIKYIYIDKTVNAYIISNDRYFMDKKCKNRRIMKEEYKCNTYRHAVQIVKKFFKVKEITKSDQITIYKILSNN